MAIVFAGLGFGGSIMPMLANLGLSIIGEAGFSESRMVIVTSCARFEDLLESKPLNLFCWDLGPEYHREL